MNSSCSSIFRFETIYCVTSVKRKETFTPGIEYMGIFEKTYFTSENIPQFFRPRKTTPQSKYCYSNATNNSRFYRWKKINQPSLLVKQNKNISFDEKKKKEKNFEHASTACSTSPPPLNTDGVERRLPPVYPRTCRIITSGKRVGEWSGLKPPSCSGMWSHQDLIIPFIHLPSRSSLPIFEGHEPRGLNTPNERGESKGFGGILTEG